MTGFFFEDFKLGQIIKHATPRTITAGDVSVYMALYGMRYAVNCAKPVAHTLGHCDTPIDEWLIFHIIFGKTVPDISHNAIANLGYAEGVFHRPIYVGTTLYAESEVIGLRENSSGKTGIVYVRSRGFDEHNNIVFSYIRWVMVRKNNIEAPCTESCIPEYLPFIEGQNLVYNLPKAAALPSYITGSKNLYDDYQIGQTIIHGGGQTIEDAEHMLATRLYQNTARVHFDAHFQNKSPTKKRLVYGGHIISLTRSLSYEGLENLMHIVALNSGTHSQPCFAGDTIYAYSEIIDKAPILLQAPGWGALRIRLIGLKNVSVHEWKQLTDPELQKELKILEMDYWGVIMKKSTQT